MYTKLEIGKQGTHAVDIAIRSRKEIQSPGEVLLDLGPDGHMRTPGVTLYPLGMGEIRGTMCARQASSSSCSTWTKFEGTPE